MGNPASWAAEQPGAVCVHPADLPPPLRKVLAALRTSPAVENESILCYSLQIDSSEPRHYVLVFNFFWSRPARIVDQRFLQREPIALWFRNIASSLLPDVRSDRMDFPRDLPHLNPAAPAEPASICLALGGLEDAYARNGVYTILDRLDSWFNDAATKSLEHDGWEPTPQVTPVTATLDLGRFQKIARKHSKTKSVLKIGQAICISDAPDRTTGGQLHFRLFSSRKSPRQPIESTVESLESYGRTERAQVTWILACAHRRAIVSSRTCEKIFDETTLLLFAEQSQCKRSIERVIQRVRYATNSTSRRCILLIGTWRPKPLRKSIPGLADGEAAHLELAGFLLYFVNTDKPSRMVCNVRPLQLVSEMSPDTLNTLAGYSNPPANTVIVGLGSLGSRLAEHVVREGAPNLRIFDYDKILPHNISRHTLTSASLFLDKAKEVELRLKAINPVCTVHSASTNVTSIGVGSFTTEITGKDTGILIDATASISVMRRLCNSDNAMRTIKVEIANNGLLGLIYCEGKRRKPRIDDLKAALPLHCLARKDLQDWLSASETFSVAIGMGCASASMPMADSRVALHAANFMAILAPRIRLQGTQDGGIGIQALTRDGFFASYSWISEPPPVVVESLLHAPQWSLRMRASVKETLDAACQASSSSNGIECGGYLYGSYDKTLKTIYVLEATRSVPTQASAHGIQLPAAGKSIREMVLVKFAKLTLLGTWHTHPMADSRPSAADEEQFSQFRLQFCDEDSPHLMVVCSPTEMTTWLAIPDLWQEDMP